MKEKQNEKVQKSPEELRRELCRNVFLSGVALVVLIVLGLAWFANNTKVTATGVKIQATGDRFELATKGAEVGMYDGNAKIEGEKKTLEEKDGSTADYYITSGEKSSISWMVQPGSNLNNNQENQVKSLQPNSSGSIYFSVLPLVQDLQEDSLEFTIEMIPYRAAKETETTDVVQINGTNYVQMGEDEAAYRLLKGHLLFFESYGQQDRYKDLLESGKNTSLTKDENTSTEKHWDYSLHWIWPGWFREYVNRGSNNLFSASEDSESSYLAMLTDINEHKNLFFYGYNQDTDIPKVEAGMSSANIDKCISFYNNADEEIGSNVVYVQVRLTVKE